MAVKRIAWRSFACTFSVAALLALPPDAAADNNKQRVTVRYPQQAAAKTPAGKYRPAKRHGAEPAAAGALNLGSSTALVVDLSNGSTIYAKNARSIAPIASITKLMTAMVVLDSGLPLDESIYVESADLDFLKHTRSRLRVGISLLRGDMLRLALMSSENRAAAALGRAYPGGSEAFVAAMNRTAVEIGMRRTRFVDPAGLSSENVSTAEDLVKMIKAAYQYPLIRESTTTTALQLESGAGPQLLFRNSNDLVKNPTWDIGLSKTGYISEAGRCLVMQARIAARPVAIVLLDSWGRNTRIGDANRIKKWLETHL
jgi:D-alanyl-D-alanine endopeptidase (penicillin-binding protein 7)